MFFFFNDTATTEIYTLSLHDALPISARGQTGPFWNGGGVFRSMRAERNDFNIHLGDTMYSDSEDRKSTRLNSSHANISYAVFCLKKKKPTTRLVSTNLTSIRSTNYQP